MKVKEMIYQKLMQSCGERGEGITALELAEILGMKRNLVSQYLNELVRENRVVKGITRPVLFSVLKEQEIVTSVKIKKDIFQSFVGAYGSLKHEIDQCRSAVQYPDKGLPILLNGSSGVGKSYLAELIHRYALECDVIKKNAPFVTLNCADYANNPELLSAILFGYAKGSFTGADQDKEGLIKQADHGYLFLDEVHRLNSESQEKLFQLMDKDEYRRIGETDIIRKAHVRLIFATTENPEEVLIHTLRRRIPMWIHIPPLQERPVKEKMELIQRFFYQESRVFQKPLEISSSALNLLLSLKAEGNVGSLQNMIKYSCASAYHKNHNDHKIFVDLSSLPTDSKLHKVEMKEYVKEDLWIDENITLENDVLCSDTNAIRNLLDEFERNYQTDKKEFENIGAIQKELYHIVEHHHIQEANVNRQLITYAIESFEKDNGIHLAMNTNQIFTYVIEIYQNQSQPIEDSAFIKVLSILEDYNFKMYSLAERMIYQLESILSIELALHVRFYIILYFIITMRNSKAIKCNALIMAHGNATASSIASAANELLEEFIFEAFDMPLYTSTELFSTLIKKYLDRINKNYPTLILVDMGSLLEVDKYMNLDDSQEIGILDQVSTSLALEVGNQLRQGVHISDMLPRLCENIKMKYRYIPPRKRKKAVVCVCISGVGTAEKIKAIMQDFIQDNVELLTYDYMRILKEGNACSVFKEYDVQCLVGTSDIKIVGVDSININHLMDNEKEDDIDCFMRKVIGNQGGGDIYHIQQKIIKAFSLENLINRLVFLNPTILIDDVEKMIFDTEFALTRKFDTDTRMMLFLHVAVLIERALLKNCDEEIYQSDEWLAEHNHEISLISSTFKDIESKFNIIIPKAEIVTILYMVLMKE